MVTFFIKPLSKSKIFFVLKDLNKKVQTGKSIYKIDTINFSQDENHGVETRN